MAARETTRTRTRAGWLSSATLGSIHNLPRGWAMMILRGVTLFPYYDLGGLWKISNENDIKHRGANYFFPEKEKEIKICC